MYLYCYEYEKKHIAICFNLDIGAKENILITNLMSRRVVLPHNDILFAIMS